MSRWTIGIAVEFRIVRLIFLEHIVNGGEQHPGNSDDRFLVSPALFQSKVTAADFRKLFGANSIKRTLNEQRLEIGPSAADPGGLFLPGTFVVLRRKPSPRAEML